ncbi:hypothetical protein [Nocardia sp. NBC_00416]|uniref:hypothetical protein n=1 Tax=Nocardia sp. NBC_00416 TaxID=2975991 RepID=UPI002E1E92B6
MRNRARLFAVPTIALLSPGAVALAAGPATADDLDEWTPVDNAEYLVRTPDHDATVFFRTPDGRNCAIYLDGLSGCDAVPIDAPAGTNQVRVSGTEPAHYVASETPTFTYSGEAKVLPEGHKVALEYTTCGVGFQGTVTCEILEHGFTIAATYGVLH